MLINLKILLGLLQNNNKPNNIYYYFVIMEIANSIYFYKSNELNGYMSNFYKCNFTDNSGIKFNCSEQYFMYIKCLTFDPDNQVLLARILNENNPGKIKQYGRKVQNFNQVLWESRRYTVMMDAINYKFNQNDLIKKKLMETGDKKLYEAAKYDRIWGIGFYAHEAITQLKNQFGRNLLGEALMEYRSLN